MSAVETVGAVVVWLVLIAAAVVVAVVAAGGGRRRPKHRATRRERGSGEALGAVVLGLALGAVGAFIVWKGSGR